jgi:hypothetical protein
MSKQPDLDWDKSEPEPGSYEWHYQYLYPSYGSGLSRKHTHIVSPGIKFKTDVMLFDSFVKMLEILEDVDFIWVYRYSGPPIFFQIPDGEAEHIDTLFIALDLYDGGTRIPMSGLKAHLIHDNDRKVVAHLNVGGFGSTKVKLRVKGTMRMTDWKELQRKVNKRFKLTFSPRV